MQPASASWFRRFLLPVVAVVAGSGPLSAGTVIVKNFATGSLARTSHPVVFSNALAPGGIIAVGTFTGVTDAQISTAYSQAEWATVVAGFSQFGASATVGTGAGNTAGLFRVISSANVNANTPFLDRPVYVVIVNGFTLASSTQAFVFKSTQTFPSDDSGVPALEVSLTDIPDGLFLLGKLGLSQNFYSTGPLANQLLQPIMYRSREEEPDPYQTWINQFFAPSDPRRDPKADPDGDGIVNERERSIGTLPNDFASALRILSVDLLPLDVTVVSWSAVAGRQYSLHASEDGVSFTQIAPTVTASGAVQSAVLNTPRPKNWLFKVRAFGL